MLAASPMLAEKGGRNVRIGELSRGQCPGGDMSTGAMSGTLTTTATAVDRLRV